MKPLKVSKKNRIKGGSASEGNSNTINDNSKIYDDLNNIYGMILSIMTDESIGNQCERKLVV